MRAKSSLAVQIGNARLKTTNSYNIFRTTTFPSVYCFILIVSTAYGLICAAYRTFETKTKAVFTCVRTRHPHTSSAHVIRFRHPHGVFTCVRVLHPSNMLNIGFLFCLSVVLLHCFYGKWLKCVKCGCYVCKSCLSLC